MGITWRLATLVIVLCALAIQAPPHGSGNCRTWARGGLSVPTGRGLEGERQHGADASSHGVGRGIR